MLLLVTVFVVACTPQMDTEPQRTPTLAGSLQPYITPSPSAVPLTATPIPTRTPLPTATPQLYTVKAGDTMGSIALEFNLDMGDLVNANPDVSPYAMSIGQNVLIPDKDALVVLPTVEALTLSFAPPVCYPALSGGLWCFVLVQNDTQGVVEGVSLSVSLYTDGELHAKETAFPLLDRLYAGETMPFPVYFADAPADRQVYAELSTAFEGTENDEHYPLASLQGVFTQIAWNAESAQVSGQVLVDSGSADRIWVLVTAYSADNQIIGVRRWEAATGDGSFGLTVASLGPAIERVSLSVEAHR